jgi:hypothetical protein
MTMIGQWQAAAAVEAKATAAAKATAEGNDSDEVNSVSDDSVLYSRIG